MVDFRTTQRRITINNRGLRRKELSSWRGGNYCLGDLKFGRVGRSDQLSLIKLNCFPYKVKEVIHWLTISSLKYYGLFMFGSISWSHRKTARSAKRYLYDFLRFFWNLTCWVLLVFVGNWAMATLEKIFVSILFR